MINIKTTVLFICIFLLTLNSFALSEDNDLASKIGVSTMNIEVSSLPGERVTASFDVFNYGKDDENIQISLADWDYDEYGVNRIFRPGTLVDRSIAECLDIIPMNLILKPGERRKVDCVVNCPKISSGFKWGLILVETQSRLTAEVEGENGIDGRFYASKTYGVKMNVIDKSKIKSNGKIIESFVKKDNNGKEGLSIESVFENTGTTFLSATGSIQLINEDGNTVDVLSIDKFKVLPGYKRIINLSYEKTLPEGSYVAITVIDIGEEHLIGSQTNFTINN